MKINKDRLKKWGLIAVFFIGLSIALYPMVSQYINYLGSLSLVQNFQEETAKLPKKEVDRRLALAHKYNETLDPRRILDPYTKEQKEGIAEYARMLEVNEQIGVVSIPSLNLQLPIFAGTSEKVLQHAVGHLEGTSLPVGGENTHAVITAHRGLPNHRLFTDLDKMKKGDVFTLKNLGETLAYKVINIKTVEPSALEEVLVVPGKDLVTLLTCTPYMINSHRLLVVGERTTYVEPKEEQSLRENIPLNIYKHAFIVVLILLVVVLAVIGYVYIRKKKKRTKI